MEKTLKSLLFRYSQAKAVSDNAASLISDLKGKIMGALTKYGETSYTVEFSDGKRLKATTYTTERDDYDAAVLRKHLDGEVYEEVIDVEITVPLADFREVLDLLDNKNEVLRILKPRKAVNKDRLDQAFSAGEIPLSVIKKARMVTSSKAAVRITESSD